MCFIQVTYKRIYTYIYMYVCVRVYFFIPSFFRKLHQTLKLQLSYTNALREIS